MRDLVLLGPPGSGKGTQAGKLSKQLGLKKISTGDLIRDHITRKTTLGVKVAQIVESGALVSDELIGELFEDALRTSQAGYIADGFPRTVAQAHYLSVLIQKLKLPKPVVICLDIDLNLLKKRILGRRSCPKCNKNYNLYFNPPKNPEHCDDDGESLIQRNDDKEETIQSRHDVYTSEIGPILSFYGEEVRHINGDQDPETIYELICKELI